MGSGCILKQIKRKNIVGGDVCVCVEGGCVYGGGKKGEKKVKMGKKLSIKKLKKNLINPIIKCEKNFH